MRYYLNGKMHTVDYDESAEKEYYEWIERGAKEILRVFALDVEDVTPQDWGLYTSICRLLARLESNAVNKTTEEQNEAL